MFLFSSCCPLVPILVHVSGILDMTCYNSIFIIIMFVAYVDYMFSIVRVVLCLCSCSYSAHPDDQGAGGRYYVSVVLIYCLSASAPYILGHVVDREGDYYSFIESSLVYSLNIGLVRLKLWGDVLLCSGPTLAMSPKYKYKIILTMIAKCNCTNQCSSMTSFLNNHRS